MDSPDPGPVERLEGNGTRVKEVEVGRCPGRTRVVWCPGNVDDRRDGPSEKIFCRLPSEGMKEAQKRI